MRKIMLSAAACLAVMTGGVGARPLDVHVHVHRYARSPGARLAAYLVRHGLLSPQQAACAALVPGRRGSRRVAQVSVYESQGGRCPGTPQPPVFLFDVFVDTVSGVVDTTPASRDELDTVL